MLTESQLAAKRKWKAKNAERIRAYQRDYYAKNTEKVLAINKKWYDANPEKTAKIRHAYYEANKTTHNANCRQWEKQNRGKANASKKKWIENNPEARAAHIILNNAVKEGKITKQPCVVCGNPKVHGHHPNDNYSKPLDVIWVCAQHHRDIHST